MSSFSSACVFAILVIAQTCTAQLPTIWLAGDSTTARLGGNSGTEGWGQYLHYSFTDKAQVNNSARAGRSMRSYTREGRFDAIAARVQKGDWVVIELGINDQGGFPDAKWRAPCPGTGDETCVTPGPDGQNETVLTFLGYQQKAARQMLALGASVILSSRIPVNLFQSGRDGSYVPSRFVEYTRLSVEVLGGPANKVWYVDHGAYVAKVQQIMGSDWVMRQYINDNTHTSPLLADYVSRGWVAALSCGTAGLKDLVVNSTSQVQGFVGGCLNVADNAKGLV